MNPWSKEEVDAIVADYFSMLIRELQGKPYSKTAHRNRIVDTLSGRNAGAVQKKYHTISAALTALGLPSIRGFKPLDNYQTLLIDAIDAHLEAHPETANALTAYARRPLSIPMQREFFFEAVVMDPPGRLGRGSGKKARLVRKIMKKYTFVKTEDANPDLKGAGKDFVFDFEQARLREEGFFEAARRVKRISPDAGPAHPPYDILSYDEKEDPLFITVKPTSCGMRFPFLLSAAELAFSAANPDGYCLYRLFDFPESPRLFILKGRLYDRVRLTPESFTARFE